MMSTDWRLKPLLDSLWVIWVVWCNLLWLPCTQLKQIMKQNKKQDNPLTNKRCSIWTVWKTTRQNGGSTLRLKPVAGRLLLTPFRIGLLYVLKNRKWRHQVFSFVGFAICLQILKITFCGHIKHNPSAAANIKSPFNASVFNSSRI